MEQLHLIIHGRVQGVFFRDCTVRKAKELGVIGWVKNLADGTVEMVAQGERARLEALRDWCNEGSPTAKVEKIEAEWESVAERFEDFRIL